MKYTRQWYGDKPTRWRQEEIRDAIRRALASSLDMYGVKNMALDSGLSEAEAEWAETNIDFKTIIVR